MFELSLLTKVEGIYQLPWRDVFQSPNILGNPWRSHGHLSLIFRQTNDGLLEVSFVLYKYLKFEHNNAHIHQHSLINIIIIIIIIIIITIIHYSLFIFHDSWFIIHHHHHDHHRNNQSIENQQNHNRHSWSWMFMNDQNSSRVYYKHNE